MRQLCIAVALLLAACGGEAGQEATGATGGSFALTAEPALFGQAVQALGQWHDLGVFDLAYIAEASPGELANIGHPGDDDCSRELVELDRAGSTCGDGSTIRIQRGEPLNRVTHELGHAIQRWRQRQVRGCVVTNDTAHVAEPGFLMSEVLGWSTLPEERDALALDVCRGTP